MKEINESNSFVSSKLVYIVVRYGQVVGVYSKHEDAVQAQIGLIQKNTPADLVIKPLI